MAIVTSAQRDEVLTSFNRSLYFGLLLGATQKHENQQKNKNNIIEPEHIFLP